MGLIFNGNGDVIKAVDGSLTVEGIDLGGSTNINAGIVTGTSANFTGAVSVGGVLTYEDVKNVDSVGIVTARGGLNVTANTDTDTLNVSGISTFGGNLDINASIDITGSAVIAGDLDVAADIRHIGDTDTRLRFETDTISARTAGSERVRIDSSGSLLIGGTSSSGATEKLRIENDSATSDVCQVTIISGNAERAILNFGDAQDHNIGRVTYDNTDNHMSLWTDNTERLRIDSSGRLLLGTTTEGAGTYAETFTIAGTTHCGMTIRSATNGVGSIYFSDGTSGNSEYRGYFEYSHTNDFFKIATAATERLRIDSSGRLLVNQSSNYTVYADSKLQISATDSTAAFSVTRWSNNGSSPYINLGKSRGGIGSYTAVQSGDRLGQINFVGADGTDLASHAASIAAYVDGTPGSNDMPGRLVFATASDGGAAETERLRIASNGQVSISNDGTTDGLLTIKGNSDQVSTPSIRLLDGGDTREVSISNESGDFIASVHGNDNAIHGHIKMFESGIFSVATGGASGSNVQRLRIDSVGDVHLGYAGNSLYFQNGFNNSNARIQNAGASNNSNLRFLTRSSGTEGERLRITSSGRIGIGTDAPATIDTNGSVDIVTNVANNSPAQFRVLNKHSVYGGGIQVKNNNARGGLEFLTAAGVNNFGIYNTTGGWYWGSTLNIPHGSVLRIGQTSGSALLNIDSQSGVDGHIIATFNGEESGGNHAGLNIAHYLCGSDDNRTGLYWEHQNVSNQRMWMGDDLRLYLKSSDPTESTAQGRYIMTVEGGSADFPDGSSYDNAAKSALEIKKHYPNSQTGNYWIYDYNGTPRQIHCEMEIDGGGWMMWHDHNASNTSMNEALGGSASSPHSGLGRGNYGNYAYYQVLIRATKVGNASREALHTIVQLDHNGNLFRKYDYGEEFFKEEVGNPYNPTLNAYFNSGDGEWIQNTAAYGGQCGSSGWSDFGSGTSTVYIREKDSRLSPGDHRSYAMHERIYCFNDNGVPMWRNSTSMGVLPYWTDIRGAAGADGSGLNSSGTQTDNLQDNGRTLYSNNGNNGDFLHGRIHGVFLGEFEIAFKLAYWWGWAHGNMNAGIGVAEVIRDSQAWPYSNSSSIQYAGFGLNNNSSNNKWYPMHHYNGDTSTTIGNSGSGYTGGNSGFNIMWRESDGTIKVRRQDNTHGTYTYGKFVGPLVFGNGTQSPMFTEVGLCWDKPWNNNGNCMR